MSKKNPLECKQNIFLTGPGGTGKTYLINEFIKNHEGRVCICAPTGTAASNIGGVTMHNLFNIPVPAYGAEPVSDNKKATREMLMNLALADTIIIDEISMASAPVFAYAIKTIKMAEKATGKKLRIIVSGDFSQLPPVVTKDDEKYFKKYGFDKSGYCFTTPEWKSCHFKTIELAEIKRQEDKEFIENLNLARKGDRKCLKYFNSERFVKGTDNISEDSICVCGTNSTADKKNTEYLSSLPGEEMDYLAKCQGKVSKDLPCDNAIPLKHGCRVDYDKTEGMRYTNGLTGIVKGFGNKIVTRKNEEGNEEEISIQTITVETEYGDIIEVGKHKWSIYTYDIDKKTSLLVKKEIGNVVQVPLKVAKAITIHKSQGKTFSNAAIAPEIFAPGQLYVALSRVRSPEGLSLTEPVFDTYLKIDPIVKKFYNNNYTWEIKQKKNIKTPVKKLVNKTTKRGTTKKKITISKKKSTTKISKSSKRGTGKTIVKKKPVNKLKTTKVPKKTGKKLNNTTKRIRNRK